MNHQDTKPAPQPIPDETNRIARMAVDAAFAVHFQLGPGLLESVYELCLVYELKKRGLATDEQILVPVCYDGVQLNTGFRLNLLVEKCLVIEIKAVETLLPVHTAQVLTYLKLAGHRLALLINFNDPKIRDGIKRIAL